MDSGADGGREVSGGALLIALELVEGFSDDRDDIEEPAAGLREAVEHWGHETITEALGMLIVGAMELAEPREGEPDSIHLVVPAVVGRLRTLRAERLADHVLPTVSGILTAAALGLSPYEWRSTFGPIPRVETVVWCYVAWAVFDLMDFHVGRPGWTAGLIRSTVEQG